MKDKHPEKNVRVFFMDEARIGQQGTITRKWALRGSRPTAIKQTRYEWIYLYAAVEPSSGANSALLAPDTNTGTFNKFLKILSAEVGTQDHVVLVLDQAGWHKSKKMKLPENITLLHLPPYSPELNCVERVWAYMRSHYLANRAYNNYMHLFKEVGDAYRRLTDDLLKSICATSWLTRTC